MVTFNETTDIYLEGFTETLEECHCGWGPCCGVDDEFLLDLGRSLNQRVILHSRGAGRRTVRVLGMNQDVLRALDLDSGNLLLIPPCDILLFYGLDYLPASGELPAIARMDCGACSGCYGLAAEMARFVDHQIGVQLPDGDMTLLVTEVVGLTLHGMSGNAMVSIRIDCIGVLELQDNVL